MHSRVRQRSRLWLELSLLVGAKLALLFAAKAIWFDHPIAVDMHMPPTVVAHHLFDNTTPTLPEKRP